MNHPTASDCAAKAWAENAEALADFTHPSAETIAKWLSLFVEEGNVL